MKAEIKIKIKAKLFIKMPANSQLCFHAESSIVKSDSQKQSSLSPGAQVLRQAA